MLDKKKIGTLCGTYSFNSMANFGTGIQSAKAGTMMEVFLPKNRHSRTRTAMNKTRKSEGMSMGATSGDR